LSGAKSGTERFSSLSFPDRKSDPGYMPSNTPVRRAIRIGMCGPV